MKVTLKALALATIFFGAAPASLSQQAVSADPPRAGCDGVEPQFETVPGATGLTYKTAGRDLRIHIFQPDSPAAKRPAIIFFFGGGWRGGMITALAGQAEALSRHGYVAAVADYRVSCRDQTTPVASVADGQSAYAWLRDHSAELKVDPARIVLSGGSAGGHLALTTAMLAPAGEKPVALVLFNPAVDVILGAARLGITPAEAARISASVLPANGLPPTIIFHGQEDKAVPIKTVRDFCARVEALQPTCEIQEYPGQGHGFFNSREPDAAIGRSPYDDTLAKAIAFLDRLTPGGQ
ncbi:MAG: alpha/beta hydrolase [Alphaproteobacteria bacterium]|nr:alpha/beta hydrolase [Alphaproteobacteria bacterium]